MKVCCSWSVYSSILWNVLLNSLLMLDPFLRAPDRLSAPCKAAELHYTPCVVNDPRFTFQHLYIFELQHSREYGGKQVRDKNLWSVKNELRNKLGKAKETKKTEDKPEVTENDVGTQRHTRTGTDTGTQETKGKTDKINRWHTGAQGKKQTKTGTGKLNTTHGDKPSAWNRKSTENSCSSQKVCNRVSFILICYFFFFFKEFFWQRHLY